MNRLTTVFMVLAGIALASTPLLVQAAQIAPNPNPAGSTLDIINDPFAVNNETPYSNEGTIAIDSNSTLTNALGATLNNGGTITLNYDDGTLTNAVGATLNNTGVVHYGYGTLNNAGTLNNFASVAVCCGGYAALNNTGTLNNFAGAFLGTGYVGTLTNAGTVNNFAGARWTYSEGSVLNSVGGTVNNYGGLNGSYGRFINGGTLNNFIGAEFYIGDLTNSVGATLNNHGLLESGLSSLANQGTWNNMADGTINNRGALQNTGTLNNAGTLNNRFSTNTGTLINTGVVTGDYLFPEEGKYTQTAGLTINNGTLSQPGGIDIQGGSLRGTGTITAPVVTLSSGAILNPGDATTLGTLTINGNLQSSGNLMFRIGGLNAGQFDVLAIHGMAFLSGGTVGFNFVNFTPVAGNSWDFLYADAISGWETLQFNLGGLSPNLGYTFSYANGVETLRVYSVPEPDSLLLLAVGIAGLLAWQWKQRGRALS